MAPPTRTSSDRLLIQETNARFWAQTGYKPGQKLDPGNPQDVRMMPLWSKIFSDVKAENKAGRLVFTFNRPDVQQGIQDAGVAQRAAAAHATAGATSQTPEEVVSNARAAAAAQSVAAQRAQAAANVQPSSVTPRDLQAAADAANVASVNTPSPAAADHVARAQVNARATANEPKEVRELRQKVTKLARARFGGSLQRMFAHYAKGGVAGPSAVEKMLAEADVGNALSRGFWVDGIMKRIDRNRDGRISAAEFDAVLNPIGARPVVAPLPAMGPALPPPPGGSPREMGPPPPPSGSPREAAGTPGAPPPQESGPPDEGEEASSTEATGPNYKKLALVGAAVAGGVFLLSALTNKAPAPVHVVISRPKKAYA